MITLEKLNGKEVTINAELIESIEAAPDTVITLVTGNRYVVKNPPQAVIAMVVEFKRNIFQEKGNVVADWQSLKKQ